MIVPFLSLHGNPRLHQLKILDWTSQDQQSTLRVGLILRLEHPHDQPVGIFQPENVRKLAEITQLHKLIITRDGERIEIEAPDKERSDN